MLRPFLSLVHDDPQTAALARDGGDVFVATSLRPYLVAALADEVLAPGRPALVVAGGRPPGPALAPPPAARRPPGAGPPPRPRGVPRPAARPLLPEPRRRVRVPSGAAAAPRRPARGGFG